MNHSITTTDPGKRFSRIQDPVPNLYPIFIDYSKMVDEWIWICLLSNLLSIFENVLLLHI